MTVTTEPTLAPTTTTEENRKTAGQRRVNMTWEITQAMIAFAVIGTALYVDAIVTLSGTMLTEKQSSGLMQLNVMAGLVIGFYFGRTNHQRTGGVGTTQSGETR